MAPTLESSLQSLAITSDASKQVYRLLEQDRFTEALKLAQSVDSGSIPRLYIAYAQYRLGREEDCLLTLGNAPDRASLHLKAQALYRLERVSLSDIYSLRTDFEVDNEQADLCVNEAAILAQNSALSKPGKDDKLQDPIVLSHEYLFNKSIYLSFQGKKEQALDVLNKALQTLNALNLDTDDHDAEIAPIYAQLAHLTNDEARNKDAHAKQTDSSTHLLTGINFSGDVNPYVIYKTYLAESKLKPSARLFSYQDRYVAYDKIVAMHSIGLSVKNASKKYIALYEDLDPERCASLRSLRLSKSALDSLERQVAADPSNVDAVVALVSKRVNQKHGVFKAISIIERVPETTRNQHPGLVGVLCALKRLTPDRNTSLDLVRSALQSSQGPAKQELLSGLIQQSLADGRLNTSAENSIHEEIEQLLKLDPSSRIAQCASSILKNDSTSEPLPLPDLSSIDIVNLELGTKRARDTEEPQRQMKKSKFKTEEQIAEERKLDPERWLPKRDRSSYKPSKKEKFKSNGGHQGGMVDESLSSQGPMQAIKTGEVPRKKKGKKSKK